MKLKRRIGERGQVTLPKDLREQLGFLPESEVYFSTEDGKIVIEKESGSFSDWSREISGKVGKLDHKPAEYRRKQIEGRLDR